MIDVEVVLSGLHVPNSEAGFNLGKGAVLFETYKRPMNSNLFLLTPSGGQKTLPGSVAAIRGCF